MKKVIIHAQGELQMVFCGDTVELTIAAQCPTCHATITAADPCPHMLGTTQTMFDDKVIFLAERAGRRRPAERPLR